MRIDEDILSGFDGAENLSNLARNLFLLYQGKAVSFNRKSDLYGIMLDGLGAELVVMESEIEPPELESLLNLQSKLLNLPCVENEAMTFDRLIVYILLGRLQVLRMRVPE